MRLGKIAAPGMTDLIDLVCGAYAASKLGRIWAVNRGDCWSERHSVGFGEEEISMRVFC